MISAVNKENNKKVTYEDDDTETTRWEQQVHPWLDLGNLYVEPRWNDTAFVQTTIELDNNLARTVIIDELKFSDVACKIVAHCQ